jgi:hypothetical protein
MPNPRPLVLSPRLLALADRVAVARVAGAAHGDEHDWLPLRKHWDANFGRRLPDSAWWVDYLQGGTLDQRLNGCVVQIVGIDRSIAGEGPWPIEAPPDGRPLAAVRFRIQRLDDDGFVQSAWDGGAHARLSLRLGSRAALRTHARRDDTDSWAIRLYRLIEVLRDWTPAAYQDST